MSLGTPALSSTGGGGGSSTITSFLGSTTNAPMNITQIGGNAVTTTIPVSGTVTANAGTGTFTIQSNASVNITQVGGASFALGQQLAAASLPIVLTASQLTTLTPPSNTGYALDSSLTTIDTDLKSNITLHAGTNTIGSVKLTDGTNTQTFMSTTTTSKFGADVNILSILGTAPTTAGKVDVKGADGDVFVRQATGTNLHTVIDSGTITAVTAITNALPVGSNIIGKVGIDQTTPGTTNGVTPVPATSGGSSVSRLISANTTNATSVKASAGQVYGWYLYNANAAARYLKLYNKASAPTVGSDTPFMTLPIPPGSAANVEFSLGIPMGTGIAFAITTGMTDADTGAVAANEVVVNLLYK